jgi:hypothetical protein
MSDTAPLNGEIIDAPRQRRKRSWTPTYGRCPCDWAGTPCPHAHAAVGYADRYHGHLDPLPGEPVNKIAPPNVVNRQEAILAVLAHRFCRSGELTDQWRTGQIIDALGLDRSPSVRASVSRSLRRLAAAGRIVEWSPGRAISGRGSYWSLPKAAAADSTHP